jgi:hypothetical protein
VTSVAGSISTVTGLPLRVKEICTVLLRLLRSRI